MLNNEQGFGKQHRRLFGEGQQPFLIDNWELKIKRG